jgi:1-acyl-sn-glycerol-3-phosphate acyltransferase
MWMEHDVLHERARKGVNPVIYRIVRFFFVPFFLIYFRLERIGRENIPREGAAIVAANHRSFLDPFVICAMTHGRPMYYVAKKELFNKRGRLGRVQAFVLNSLGAFPVDRGAGDTSTIATAKQILDRGDIVLIFPEGTRIRPGALGKAHKGVGRLALESGAPVIPVAVIGTESVRKGWRIRPHKVRIRVGRPIQFPHVPDAKPQLAATVTDRIWPCVMLQWEWLGGMPPVRRAAVIGAGSWGTSLAVGLARAGYHVDLGTRTQEQADALNAGRVNQHYLPDVELPANVHVARASTLELGGHDLVCLAVPARALPAVMAAHGDRIPHRAGLLVLSKGLVAPLGTVPSVFVGERSRSRAIAVLGGPAHAAEAIGSGASVILASSDRAFARQLGEVLRTVGLDVVLSADVTGVELAGCAKNVAVLAASAAAGVGPNAAGSVAGKLFAELEVLARSRGAEAGTFAGLAGTGDLVATLIEPASRNRRAGELLFQGVEREQIPAQLGHACEALDTVPLLAAVALAEGVKAPTLTALTALVEGRIDPAQWAAKVTAPQGRSGSRPVRAA